MQTVLIVIHLMIVVALVAVVLLQRSEGGALGIGGGGGSGFMSARGAADTLTRTTGILAAAFFVTSIALGILARYETRPTDILRQIEQTGPTEGKGVLDRLGGSTEKPEAPKEQTSGGKSESQIPTGQ